LEETLKPKSLQPNFIPAGAVHCHLQCTQANSACPLPGQLQDLFCARRKAQRRDREGWKQVSAQSCKRNPSLPSQPALQNRYKALGMADEAHNETEVTCAATLAKVTSTSSSQQNLH